MEDAGTQGCRVPGDIADEDRCRELIQKAVDEFGRIDVLVNNAAYQMKVDGDSRGLDRTAGADLPHQHLRHVLAGQAALPHMKEGGSIINSGLHPGLPALAGHPRLRQHQGRHRHLHQGARPGAHRARHPRQLRGAGPGVDAARPSLDPPRRSRSSADSPMDRPRSPPSWRPPSCSSPRTRQLRQRRDPRRNGRTSRCRRLQARSRFRAISHQPREYALSDT